MSATSARRGRLVLQAWCTSPRQAPSVPSACSEGSLTIHGTLSPKRPPRRSRKLLRARIHDAASKPRVLKRPPLHFVAIVGILALIVGVGAFPVQITEGSANPVLNTARFTLPGLAAAVPTSDTQSLTGGPVPLTVLAPSVQSDVVTAARDDTSATLAQLASQQAAGASAQGSVDGGSQNERIPIFFEYQVQSGDTLGAIAARFSVTVDHIRWNNADVVDSNSISTGMILQIPSVPGIVHSVRAGETVTEIARRYDADVRDIVEFRANNLFGDPNNIQSNSLILVPGGRIVPLVVAPPERPGAGTPGDFSSSGWTWPAQGMLSSAFGPSHPLGIDIAAPYGTPIYAANSGTVSFAGGNPCCSYGYHIIIDHGGGWESLYAHLSDFAVTSGYVNAGDVIGWIGMTGRTTGPHVHFEIRRNGVYQNPMNSLP